MYSQDTNVRDILEDYLKEEKELENQIKQSAKSRLEIERDEEKKKIFECSKHEMVYESCIKSARESELRNQIFLKDLEGAKARLRTIASFTPTDQELRVLAGAYRGLLGNVAQSHQP